MSEADLLEDSTPATRGFIAQLLHKIGEATADRIEKRIEAKLSPLLSRVATLETRLAAVTMMLAKSPEARATVSELEGMIARVKALELRPAGMKYVGVWRDGVGFQPQSVCSFDGSMWHTEKATTAKPGTSSDWVLCVKHGRDLR